MNKTYNINISGCLFVINDDAFELLENYLKTLQNAFCNVEDGADLIADIENRIAEILLIQTENSKNIVSLQMVDDLITQMGKPEEIIIENVEGTESVTGENKTKTTIEVEDVVTPPPYEEKVTKRLFRDKNNKMIAGVCSGIASYFNIDVAIVRIAFVLLAIFTKASMVLIYLILWICIPEAKTPLQQMQMKGEKPTMANIGQNVRSEFKGENSNNFNSVISQVCNIFVKILMIVVLIIIAAVFVCLISGAVCVVLALLGCLFDFSPEILGLTESGLINLSDSEAITLLLFALGIIITLTIPMFTLCRLLIISVSDRDINWKMGKTTKISLTLVWIIGIIMSISVYPMILKSNIRQHILHKNEVKEKIVESDNDENEIMTLNPLEDED